MMIRKRLGRWILATLLILALAALPNKFASAAVGAINKHTFSGRYVSSYHGFDSSITGTSGEPNPPAIPYAVSGVLFSDGQGNVKGFENIDYGAPGTGAAATCDLSGTYTVGQSHNSMNGWATLNLTSSCATVTCTGTATPTCTAGTYSNGSPTQWFCAISGPLGGSIVCTEMGEAASGTTFQTPISALTWDREE